MNLPEEFAAAIASASVDLGSFGGRVHWYAEVTSTNDVMSRLADGGAEEGTVAVAEAQSAGRGRRGHVWHSPPDVGLYVSVLLRPSAASMPLVTVAAGVAVAEGIQRSTGLVPALKWPNDVFLGSRKVAGILAEAAVASSGAQYVVLGFGINVMRSKLPADVAARATSLEEELGRRVDRGAVLAACLASLAARCADLDHGHHERVTGQWRELARPSVGRFVEWSTGAGVRRGVVEGLDDAGALLVRSDGALLRLTSGALRWI